jgi:AGZA family xanthine/uracil permease-like MFS transporter
MSTGSTTSPRLPWFTRGDADGFIGLFIDNLLQLLLIAVLTPLICGLPVELVITHILPAAAVSILFGNLFYTWQARRLARRTGRTDVTALPYGINTVSLIAYIFLVMAPIWRETGNVNLVWQAGVFACLLSGFFELAGAFCVDFLRRYLPRAALLSTLAGIALTFIAMGFAFQIFAMPAIAVAPMLLIVLAYACRARLSWGLPAGFVAIGIGVASAWLLRWLGLPSFSPPTTTVLLGFHWPTPDFSSLWQFIITGEGWRFLAVIFPMSLFNVVGSLQSLESAEAAGDRYETRSSLAANGLGSLLAGFFGSPFPTTIYIGHPGWKAMGAGQGYSALNGVVIAALCFSGTTTLILQVVPLEVTLGILIWIGIVMMAQAYQETLKEHALAVSMGLVPSLGAWAYLLITSTLQVAGHTLQETYSAFGSTLYIEGVIALNQGFLLSSMLLAALVAFTIDRRWLAAMVTSLALAVLSAGGLIHAWEFAPDGSAVGKMGWMAAPAFFGAYLGCAAILMVIWFWSRFSAPPSADAPSSRAE